MATAGAIEATAAAGAKSQLGGGRRQAVAHRRTGPAPNPRPTRPRGRRHGRLVRDELEKLKKASPSTRVMKDTEREKLKHCLQSAVVREAKRRGRRQTCSRLGDLSRIGVFSSHREAGCEARRRRSLTRALDAGPGRAGPARRPRLISASPPTTQYIGTHARTHRHARHTDGRTDGQIDIQTHTNTHTHTHTPRP